MSRSYTSSPPHVPPWHVAGQLLRSFGHELTVEGSSLCHKFREESDLVYLRTKYCREYLDLRDMNELINGFR
jgi:hypothetical protein